MRFIQLASVLRRGAVAAGITGLSESAFAAGPKVYVGNFKDNTVSVVDIDAAQGRHRPCCRWPRAPMASWSAPTAGAST